MKNTSFKMRARDHQIQFRQHVLHLKNEEYETYLTDRDAELGKNFFAAFPGLLEVVQDRYPFIRRKIMFKNMLRSEHVPFNFFAPLKLDKIGEISGSVIREMVGFPQPILVKGIEFEWPKSTNSNLLGDHTALDVYVECEGTDGKSIGIGIEVKYTEKSYPYGKREQAQMENKKSTYHKYSKLSGLYRDGAIICLAQRMLKQPWRNHLLGAAKVVEGCLDEFYSVLLYPEGNTYQKDVANEYSCLIKKEHASRFVSVTFEKFIEIGRTVCAQNTLYMSWIDYLEQRYIVS